MEKQRTIMASSTSCQPPAPAHQQYASYPQLRPGSSPPPQPPPPSSPPHHQSPPPPPPCPTSSPPPPSGLPPPSFSHRPPLQSPSEEITSSQGPYLPRMVSDPSLHLPIRRPLRLALSLFLYQTYHVEAMRPPPEDLRQDHVAHRHRVIDRRLCRSTLVSYHHSVLSTLIADQQSARSSLVVAHRPPL